ncbi:hypothetical protein OFC03_32145, partial [Escherichia coli]|nr:hypothetical protein [Escherichia coli]
IVLIAARIAVTVEKLVVRYYVLIYSYNKEYSSNLFDFFEVYFSIAIRRRGANNSLYIGTKAILNLNYNALLIYII